MNSRSFLRNDHFSIFGHFDAWEPLYMAKPLQRGALGNTSMGPRQFLGPNHNPEKIASLIRSPTTVLGRYIIRKDLRKRQKKRKNFEKGNKFNRKKFIIFFLFVIERWDHHSSIDIFLLYMLTKCFDSGLIYSRDIW